MTRDPGSSYANLRGSFQACYYYDTRLPSLLSLPSTTSTPLNRPSSSFSSGSWPARQDRGIRARAYPSTMPQPRPAVTQAWRFALDVANGHHPLSTLVAPALWLVDAALCCLVIWKVQCMSAHRVDTCRHCDTR